MPAVRRFAVNAGPLRNPVTGVGRYIRELMRKVETDGRFTPEYFCALRWVHKLDDLPQALPGDQPRAVSKAIDVLRPLVRRVARRNFSAGERRGDFAFYFEPAFIPYPTSLPTVVTVHDLSYLRHPETHPVDRVRDLERDLPAAVRDAARILAVSEFTRREVIDVFGVAPERIVATPLGADARFGPHGKERTSAVMAKHGLTHDRYFLGVGTLEPRKNLLTVIEAHARLPAAIRSAYPLVVVGMKGWLTHALDRRLELARSRGDVRLLGYVSEDDLPLIYAGAACLAYPSIYEGFGLPVLEAMASGVPVIAARRASLPEVVGDAGILLEPEDVDGFSSFMSRIVEDASFAAEHARKGLVRAGQFTWRKCAALTIEAWEDVARVT